MQGPQTGAANVLLEHYPTMEGPISSKNLAESGVQNDDVGMTSSRTEGPARPQHGANNRQRRYLQLWP